MPAATINANRPRPYVNRPERPPLSLVISDTTDTIGKKLDTNVPQIARAFATALVKTHYPSTTAVVVVTGESWDRFQADAFEGQPLAWLDAQQNGYRAAWGFEWQPGDNKESRRVVALSFETQAGAETFRRRWC